MGTITNFIRENNSLTNVTWTKRNAAIDTFSEIVTRNVRKITRENNAFPTTHFNSYIMVDVYVSDAHTPGSFVSPLYCSKIEHVFGQHDVSSLLHYPSLSPKGNNWARHFHAVFGNVRTACVYVWTFNSAVNTIRIFWNTNDFRRTVCDITLIKRLSRRCVFLWCLVRSPK